MLERQGCALPDHDQIGFGRAGVHRVGGDRPHDAAHHRLVGSRIATFLGEGPGIDRLASEIAALPGVESAAPFGAALHVSGPNRQALEQALTPYRREPFHWSETEPTLEDVFIHLMTGARDNFQ